MKESILTTIRAGKYVDLTKLTPRAALATSDGFQMVMGRDTASGDPAVNVIPKSYKCDFRSFHEWLVAFLLYAQAYLRCFPARAGGVMAYIERMTMYSSRYLLENWVAYDKMFRQALPTSPHLLWGMADKALLAVRPVWLDIASPRHPHSRHLRPPWATPRATGVVPSVTSPHLAHIAQHR